MIQAAIFDLDGVLVKTEEIKALSYSRAFARLCPGMVSETAVEDAYHESVRNVVPGNEDACSIISETEVIDTYRSMVGRSRREMAEALINRFGLENTLRRRMTAYGVTEPWQALIKVRMPIYESLISDPELLRYSQWPHNVLLLHSLRKDGHRSALATMSEQKHVQRILDVLGLTGSFDCVVTGEDVRHGKPDPEIYLLISRGLSLPPSACLVFEDSPSGIRAGLAAGMPVIAITTPFTREAVHSARILDERWIVDDPATLRAVVSRMLEERKKEL